MPSIFFVTDTENDVVPDWSMLPRSVFGCFVVLPEKSVSRTPLPLPGLSGCFDGILAGMFGFGPSELWTPRFPIASSYAPPNGAG
jgi:hypothetical protein